MRPIRLRPPATTPAFHPSQLPRKPVRLEKEEPAMTRRIHLVLVLCLVVACVLPVTGSAALFPDTSALEKRVTVLEKAVATLQSQVAALQKPISAPKGAGTGAETPMTDSK